MQGRGGNTGTCSDHVESQEHRGKGGGTVTGNIYENVYTGMGYEEKEKQKREYKSSVGKPPVVREQHHR